MAKIQNKTQPTKVSPSAFLKSIEHDKKREDGQELLKFFKRVTGMTPKMWGPTMIGYGRYAYKTQSGREGEFFLTGFSPRKTALTIYIMPGYRDMSDKLKRLGKHKIGKSCLYIKKLEDVDMNVLEEIVCDGLDYMHKNYETWEK